MNTQPFGRVQRPNSARQHQVAAAAACALVAPEPGHRARARTHASGMTPGCRSTVGATFAIHSSDCSSTFWFYQYYRKQIARVAAARQRSRPAFSAGFCGNQVTASLRVA